jgi:hypothetical protein
MIPSLEIEKASDVRLFEMGRQFPHAGASALNKMIASVRTAASSEIRQGYNIRKKDIDPLMTVKKARSSDLEAVLTVRQQGLPASYFSPKQVKKKGGGVTVKVKRSGGRTQLAKAFIATMRYGEQVFIRTTKARGPVKALYGPSLMQLFSGRHIKNLISNLVRTKLPELIRHEIEFRMSRANTSSEAGSFGGQGEMLSR